MRLGKNPIKDSKMKIRSWPLLFGLFAGVALHGQIKIGDNPQNLDPSSVLELESSNRVLVITRVTTAEMDAITPIRGALAYNIDTNCIHFYDGTQWLNLCDSLGLTFSTDPVVNDPDGPQTIVITQTGGNYNFEVAPNSIRSAQIVDGGVNGVDIQNNSIGQNKLADNSVGAAELQTNSVSDDEINYATVTLSDFTNDVGFITGAQIVSTAPGNVLTDSNGAYYDDTPLQSAIDGNMAAIAQNSSDITTKENSVNKSNGPLGTSAVLFPTENSVRTYVDAAVGGVGGTGNITSSDLAVTGGTNATFNNVTLEIQPGAVGTAELANGSVNNTKLALNAVQTTNILNGTITTADIAPSAPAPTNTQVLTTSTAGNVAWIDLPSGGSGSTEVVDDITLSGIGTVVDPFKIQPVTPAPAIDQMLITNTSGNIAWVPVATGGGTTELADQITITGNGQTGTPFKVADGGITSFQIANETILSEDILDGTILGQDISNGNITPIKIEPSTILGQFLRTEPITGNVIWDDLPVGTGGAVSSDGITIVGDGVATDLQVLDGGITAIKLNNMGAASGEVLKWNGTVWAPAADAGGTAYTAGTGLTLNGTAFDVDP
ncbi:MAG: hypothetical protein MUO53_01780, partial [Maribacter sp.]|nr:hypothetical protein [Maribacter sp.]